MKQGWERKTLGDIAKFYRGLTYSKGDEADMSSKMVLRSNNVDLDTNSLVLEDLKCLREDFVIDDDKKVKPNTILICMSNGSKQHIGKVAYIQDEMDFAFGGFMGLIAPACNMSGKYVYYTCISSYFKHFLAGIGNGIGITNLRFSDLSSFSVLVPPISEQEKIVAELDCLSGIIEKKKQQLKELDNLAQSIFYEMFGDPVENDKGWDIVTLSKNVKVKGRVGWKGYKKEDLRDSGPLAIGGGHLTDSGGVDLSSPVFLSMEKYLESPEIMIEVGDVILVQRGTIGKVGLIANDIGMATINPCVLILRPENMNSIYLLHYFLNESIQTHLKTLIKGVAQPMITQQQVNGLLLPMPPLYLQQDFASKIEAIEKQKELIKQSIQETETLFNSRMDYYFN